MVNRATAANAFIRWPPSRWTADSTLTFDHAFVRLPQADQVPSVPSQQGAVNADWRSEREGTRDEGRARRTGAGFLVLSTRGTSESGTIVQRNGEPKRVHGSEHVQPKPTFLAHDARFRLARFL